MPAERESFDGAISRDLTHTIRRIVVRALRSGAVELGPRASTRFRLAPLAMAAVLALDVVAAALR